MPSTSGRHWRPWADEGVTAGARQDSEMRPPPPWRIGNGHCPGACPSACNVSRSPPCSEGSPFRAIDVVAHPIQSRTCQEQKAMISRRVFRTAALAVAVLTAGGAFAQSGSGTIAGLVVDSSGGAIPGAQVRVDHEDTGVTSDRDILVGKVDHKLVGKVDHKPGMNDLLTVRHYLNNSGTDVTGSYGNPVADPLSDASDVRVSRWFNTA